MRTYTEREIAAIIERAAERQAEADQREGAPGLTLDEIEKLGADAGIDPAHLRAAAQEVGTHGAVSKGDTGMTRTHVHVERWVDGPLTSEAWEDTVGHLRHHFGADMSAMMGGTPNEVQQVGQSHEWRHTSGLGVQTHVTASPRGDRTRLRVTQLVGLSSTRNEGIAYGGLIAFFVTLGGTGAVAALFGSPIGPLGAVGLATLLFVLTSAVAVPTVTRLDARWREKKLRQLGDLADDLAPILAAPADLAQQTNDELAAEPPASSELTSPTPSPQLDLDALGDAPDADVPSSTRTRSR